jgi:hypothetical protein
MRSPNARPRYRGRKKGAVTYKHDAVLLPMLDIVIRIAARERGLKPHAAILWFMREGRAICRFGASDYAMTWRLYQKWRAGQFRRYRPPDGIDPMRFTLRVGAPRTVLRRKRLVLRRFRRSYF